MSTIGLFVPYIHSSDYIVYKRSIDGTIAHKFTLPSNYWGLIALICMDLLFFFSTEFWRKRSYNVFLATHIVGFCLLLPAVSYFFQTVTTTTKTLFLGTH